MRGPRTPLHRIQHLPQHQDHQAYHPPLAVATSERLLVPARMTTETSVAFQSPSPVHQRQIASPDMTEAPVSSAPLPAPPKPSRLYTTIPLPPQVDPGVSIIPFLQSGSGSGLDIDLPVSRCSSDESTATVNDGGPSKAALANNGISLGMEYVTVWDVLVTIVESLRLPIPMIPGADSNGMRGGVEPGPGWITYQGAVGRVEEK
ncbi:hypothetical protein D9758_018866 [Tetrapyrgos nigripes]|uniref:Uncharacterized protein n=1 Tax=Tetrapyrgos nigripes TaxID=182062 RepID=A0A8H5BUZ5_9AGAR|nr:hypothetical protein D9758_018866 [Tetrapyrgos nigripes]